MYGRVYPKVQSTLPGPHFKDKIARHHEAKVGRAPLGVRPADVAVEVKVEIADKIGDHLGYLQERDIAA